MVTRVATETGPTDPHLRRSDPRIPDNTREYAQIEGSRELNSTPSKTRPTTYLRRFRLAELVAVGSRATNYSGLLGSN